MSDQQKVYEFVIVYTPPVEDLTKVPPKPRILMVDNIMARSEDDARIKAAREIPDDYETDDIEIQVRPF